MKKSSLLTAGVLISLLVSSVSLGFQLSKGRNKVVTKFDKYYVPAQVTELEHRLELADVQMIRQMSPFQYGMSLPQVFGPPKEDGRIHILFTVSEKDLPSSYDERKLALISAADLAAKAVMVQFEKNEVTMKDITVEFQSWENMGHGIQQNYAVFSNGELTFH